MSPQHVDPQQAVDIHQDIQSKSSLGIHWGTFMLTYEVNLEDVTFLLQSSKNVTKKLKWSLGQREHLHHQLLCF